MNLPEGALTRADHRDEGGQSKQVGTAAPRQVHCLSCSRNQFSSTCRGPLKHSLTQTFQDQQLWGKSLKIRQALLEKHRRQSEKSSQNWKELCPLQRPVSVSNPQSECGRTGTPTPQM